MLQDAGRKEALVKGVVWIRPMEKMDGKQRRQWGQQWLYQAVAASGYPQVTAGMYPVLRTDKGKPYFAEEAGVYFSISHSKDYWACVVADEPVGMDLQFHKQGKLEQVSSRFFHPDEVAWLETQTWPASFFEIWTAKESYVKWTGDGIDRHFGDFSVADETGLRDQIEGAYFWRSQVEAEYSLCLCGSQPWDEVSIMRWESGEDENWIMPDDGNWR